MVEKEKTIKVRGRITTDLDLDTFGCLLDIIKQLYIANQLKAAELQLKYGASGSDQLSEKIRVLITKLASEDVEP